MVTNLKPAKLRGVESQGMLLAAEDKEKVEALTVDKEPGTQVVIEGFENNTSQIKFDDFLKLKLAVKDRKITFWKRASYW